MEVKINKEIRDYQESVFMGLSMRQTVCSALAAGAAIGIYFAFRDAYGTEITSWLCIAGALPFALLGFVKYHGMNCEQFFAAYIRSEFMYPTRLAYKSENLYAKLLDRECDRK